MKGMMNLKQAARLAVVLMALLVAACGDIDQGQITGKEHHAAWTQTTFIMVGKVMVPQIIHHPERWTLLITDGTSEGWCNVSEADWNEAMIGEWVTCN